MEENDHPTWHFRTAQEYSMIPENKTLTIMLTDYTKKAFGDFNKILLNLDGEIAAFDSKEFFYAMLDVCKEKVKNEMDDEKKDN